MTYRYAPDLHPVSVANHEAERRVSSTAVHLHKLWIAGSVCANRECDIKFSLIAGSSNTMTNKPQMNYIWRNILFFKLNCFELNPKTDLH